jgi:catechol 2,3-dioxygenase-like lactoylglutathione lyase family enzyme
MQLEGIDHIALSVRDVARSAQWYVEVLGFEPRHEGMWNGVPVFVGKGTTAIALFPLHDRESEGRAPSRPEEQRGRHGGRPSMLHFAMRTNRQNFAAAQEELRRRGIQFEFQDHEISQSIYFRDPDAHELEITTYDLERDAPSSPARR